MIQIKDAVAAAKDFSRAVYPEDDLADLRLEEVEAGSATRSWQITLGWVDPNYPKLTLLNGIVSRAALPRVYKTFDVDGDTGEVRSMKIREVA